MRTVLVLLVAGSALLAAPVPKEWRKKTDDAMAIVGTWKVERVTDNGNEIDKTAFESFVFKADGSCTQNVAGGGQNDFTFTLDDRVTPRRLKLKFKGMENVQLIYDLSGDKLRLGYVVPGVAPAKIETAEGLLLLELKRDKSVK